MFDTLYVKPLVNEADAFPWWSFFFNHFPGHRARMDTLVVDSRPLGVGLILGMSGISRLGGVSVQSPSKVRFYGAAALPALGADAPDLSVQFDARQRKWTVACDWAEGAGPMSHNFFLPFVYWAS